jgi:hypothetical protein
MKQSSVEWLFEQVVNLDWKNLQGEEKIKIFEKAKEMEKQQVVNAYVVANGMLIEHSKPMAEQYYDENIKAKNITKKVLVKYKIYQDAPHPLLDGEWVEKSKVVKVTDVTEVNSMFKNITDVKILE